MVYLIISIFLLPAIVLMFPSKGIRTITLFSVIAIGAVFTYFLYFIPILWNGEVWTVSHDWIPTLGVSFSFYVDGLSLFFTLLILFFGILVLLYSSVYMAGKPMINRFYAYLLLFMASMVGLVLAANAITLFIFWEMTSFSSYLLIGYYHADSASRDAARKSLLVTGLGGLAMMAGFVLLGYFTDTYVISEWIANKTLIQEYPGIVWAVILILMGAFTKSAQFPFHFWLPAAMKAPTPVSAYLHSATMVKAGVYLIFRLNPIFEGLAIWNYLIFGVGAVTAILGSMVAFRADDLKEMLAYTTIGALGIFFMMTGVGSSLAIQGTMIYLVAHALYKGSLFMIAGTLDHTCGTRRLSELSGQSVRMPFTAFSTVLAVLSMAGLIPFLGFLGKEVMINAALDSEQQMVIAISCLVVSGIFFSSVGFKIVDRVFISNWKKTEVKRVNEAPFLFYFSPLILTLFGLVFGLLASSMTSGMLKEAAAAIHGDSIAMDLKLWHGFNFPLLLSLVTWLIGGMVFWIDKKWSGALKLAINPGRFLLNSLDRLYDWLLDILMYIATVTTRFLQNGYLRNYISVYIVVLIALILTLLGYTGNFPAIDMAQDIKQLKIYEATALLLIGTIISFTFMSRSRLTIIASIGIVGYAIAFLYTIFSAPDVAITQFLAETLGLILLAVIIPKLPKLKASDVHVKWKYFAISISFGLMMAVMTFIGLSYESNSTLKRYFIEQSGPLGHGDNVVNVILVDFRAFDTLGEISVLVITMIGIYSLMKYGKKSST